MTRFRSLVLDVDSTLSGIEGIDWLAGLRGADVARAISDLTERAMRGDLSIDSIYSERLALVRPTRLQVIALGEAYVESVAPGAKAAIEVMRAHDVHVVLISGGIREAILPLVAHLGMPESDLHAVSVFFDVTGSYAGFDETAPLAHQHGKRKVVEQIGLERPVIAVGDGMTDAEMAPAVDSFVAFTGFATRESVVAAAERPIKSFDELAKLVLG